MKFKADEIASVLREEIAQYRSRVDVAHTGRVLEVGDGIAQIYGLGEAMAGELLQFESGAMGQVFNLEDSSIGAVIYTQEDDVKAGEEVRATGRLLEVPVGEAMLGRVIDPLGNVLDGGAALACDEARPVEFDAPGIAARQPVTEPLQTGVKAVDAMTPIGRGQRELIIGDRKTGKTAIAIDTIINQKDTGVICVYVAVGQKESTVASTVETLRRCGAMEYTIVVSAASSDAAPLQYVAPYAGCAIAEYFMHKGRHTLAVYDDLTKQAQAYRQISLLLRRPPGREAYPGDVFYLHSRLLERACKLAERHVIAPAGADLAEPAGDETRVYVGPLGREEAKKTLAEGGDEQVIHTLPDSGGSMTALPICETQEGEVSAYIPTNLISITDGQIYLEPGLFFAGVRPAINVGISVSRVGYKAAIPAMKVIAASLRLDLAAYRELESFAQLGMELDPASQRQLDRGERMVRLLTQPQYQPMDVVDQVIAIAAGTGGLLDDLPVDDMPKFEAGLIDYIKNEYAEWYNDLADEQTLPDDRRKRLQFLIKEYKDTGWQEHKKARRRKRRSQQDQ
ncbi:MAG: F0F1 ATP synthase subunit alpha [Planctomycetes bacterium]|nr:F0F1 ATP synthase subunit alpha [Phycisphaerae bacterium]NBB95134.1 F0F1 ATP synthase subunit alpha [Planctomycetota bacterium]